MLKAIQLGQQLTKKEMKEVKGGGTCCAHYNTGCGDVGGPESCCGGGGLSKAQAQALANDMAMEDSGGASWCCSSCNTLC